MTTTASPARRVAPSSRPVQPPAPAPADKYAHLSREELLEQLVRRDATQRFGLVWERPPQDAERALNGDFVALDLDPKLSVGAGPYENLIVEGDNFDALRALRATHKGRVKAIYIDPPYNTGNQDFVYNDRYVDREHRFRHSLWLEFMHQRLAIARELLRDDGVILVSIGEDEYAHLSMLMDQVFPGMKVGSFVWRTRQGANDAGDARFSQDHEYVLCYAGPKFRFTGVEKSAALYKNPDNDPRGPWKSADITVPVKYTDRRAGSCYYPVQNPATGVWYPCNPDSVWRFGSEAHMKPGQVLKSATMEQRIREGRILWPRSERVVTYASRQELDAAIASGTAPSTLRADLPDLDFWVGRPIGFGRPQVKRFWTDMKESTKPLTSWIASTLDGEAPDNGEAGIATGTTQEGTQVLQRIMGGKVFDFPKPLSLIKGLISQATGSGDEHIVLDFFAGSGTTGHAVLELNAEDNGNRRFILVSSTEATENDPEKNVCRDVTRERIARVIDGYAVRGRARTADVDGLGGSFAYLRATRLPMATVSARLQHRWVWTAVSMLHGSAVQNFVARAPIQHLELDGLDVIYVPDVDGLSSEAAAAIRAVLKRRKSAVIYSWTPGLVRQRFDYDGVTVKKIPDELIARFGSRRSGGRA